MPWAGERRYPVAIGLIVDSDDLDGRAGRASDGEDASRRRVRVALAAAEAGYFLLDVIEVSAGIGVTAGDRARLWSLAVRTDADAVLVLGLDDVERMVVDQMTAELRLVLRIVPTDSTDPSERGGGDGPEVGVHANRTPQGSGQQRQVCSLLSEPGVSDGLERISIAGDGAPGRGGSSARDA
jgi:hypothetical protein